MSRVSSANNDQTDRAADIATAAAVSAIPKALRAGMRAPAFNLLDSQGNVVSLQTALRAGPVVLNFLRGAWCRFGAFSLAQLASTYQKILDIDATAFAVVAPSRTSAGRLALPIPELIDLEMKVTRAYGLAFELPEALRPRYLELGYVPPKTRKPGRFLAPIQATYLIDQNGLILLSHIDADYRHPLDNETLLEALRSLRARSRAREQALKPRGNWRLI